MSHATRNTFGAEAVLSTPAGAVTYFRLAALEESGVGRVSRLPLSIRVLLEAMLRNEDGRAVTAEDVRKVATYDPADPAKVEIPFKPARVLVQDFTGVPALVDLAALRDAMKRMGGDPQRINPMIPVDLVIDHSVQVDAYASPAALGINAGREFERNRERYEFLNWGQKAFSNLTVVPPASGICHQVNLEHLGRVVQRASVNGRDTAFPDSLVGLDSHTPMINGLGVVGWGVGGIEAEAVMLGQPIYMLMPPVVGVRLSGALPAGATATDLALTVTQTLRAKGVVGRFVEFFGAGLSSMTLADRATIANMAPEYGATIGYFPVDAETLNYLRQTGRPDALVDLVERYTKEQGLFRTDGSPDPEFADVVELNLSAVKPSLAGPRRPQDRVGMERMKSMWREALRKPVRQGGYELAEDNAARTAPVAYPDGTAGALRHGDVVIAAITSCTNTSNPSVMIGAGLLAKKAVEAGLSVRPHVKTSLAPGSKVVTGYLERAGLTQYLDALGFHVVGYGCTTCIGNSGPLPEHVGRAIEAGELVAASVLSGNRNFEGRISQQVKANFLASPPLVVAYALAGTVDIDLTTEPIGRGKSGRDVYLRDIWPTREEIAEAAGRSLDPEMFRRVYARLLTDNPDWNEIPARGDALYAWDAASTYIQEPPFFLDMTPEAASIRPIEGARVLVHVGDSITTDHISPAGAIAATSPAGTYLRSLGVAVEDFNSYGSRRGNDRVMVRGTFANIRLRNRLAPGTEGGWTTHLPTGEVTTIHEAAMRYREAGTPLVVLAGADYGMGSSRDWAAKGTYLLGVRAVFARSFERIHRSNLVGMGILPLQFKGSDNAESLGLTGRETFAVRIGDDLAPGQDVAVEFVREDGKRGSFVATCRVDTPIEVDYYRNGGILQTVLRNILKNS